MSNRTNLLLTVSIIVVLTATPCSVSAGLIAFWDFDSDTTAAGDINDQSGNGNDGSATTAGTGTVGFSASVPTAIAGRSTMSLDLSTNVPSSATNGGWLDMDSPNYKGILGTSPRTVSAWINTANAADQSIIQWGTASAGNLFWVVLDETTTSGTWSLSAQVHSGGVRATTSLTDGDWHHIAVVLPDDGTPDITDASLYIDGVLEALTLTSSEAFNTVSGQNVEIGRAITFGPDRFDGFLDEVALYDQALSADKIALLAEGTAPDELFPVPEPSTFLLLGLGALGIVHHTGRRRRRS